jgi:3-hydroxyacyl-[acyl-carrier-protein] dehydratase
MRDIEAIRKRIPLRFPYLLIDRILEEGPDRVVALKNVTIGEPFFQGHFPEPGTLVLEAMAQTAALLVLADGDSPTLGYLVGVEAAKFRRKVVPGDQLRLEAIRGRTRRGLLQAGVTASVDGELAASATLSLLVARDGEAQTPLD